MNALEDQLRQSLREHATLPRLSADVATGAIRGAHRVRRRRLAVATGVAAFAVIASIGGAVLSQPTAGPQFPGGTGSPPAATSVTTTPGTSSFDRYGVRLDVLEPGNHLRTLDGAVYDLAPGDLDPIRVPAGWLYGETGQDAHLLRTDGTAIALVDVRANQGGLEQPSRPVVSADGTRLAWVRGSTMYAGTLSRDGVRDVVSSPVPANTFAATWIGPRVVVGNTYATGCCGYNKAQFDVWDPARGNFVAHWTKDLSPVYGPVPAGQKAFAQVLQTAQGAGCLATVDGVAGMATSGKTCLPGLGWGSLIGALAPDGRHLVEGVFGATDPSEMVVDLTGPAPVRSSYDCMGDKALAWESNTSVLIGTGDSHAVMRCDLVTGTTTSVGTIDGTLVRRYGV